MVKPIKPLTDEEWRALGGNWQRNRILFQHPDGKPWDKCCGEAADYTCDCLMRKPRKGTSRFMHLKGTQPLKDLIASAGRFFCVHRTTPDGYYRECGGWAKMFPDAERTIEPTATKLDDLK